MVFAFQIKGDANRYKLFLPLLNLHCLYIVNKYELEVKIFKYVTKTEGRALPKFPPYLRCL